MFKTLWWQLPRCDGPSVRSRWPRSIKNWSWCSPWNGHINRPWWPCHSVDSLKKNSLWLSSQRLEWWRLLQLRNGSRRGSRSPILRTRFIQPPKISWCVLLFFLFKNEGSIQNTSCLYLRNVELCVIGRELRWARCETRGLVLEDQFPSVFGIRLLHPSWRWWRLGWIREVYVHSWYWTQADQGPAGSVRLRGR